MKPKKNYFVCMRCGCDKVTINAEKRKCTVWGKTYKKHLYILYKENNFIK